MNYKKVIKDFKSGKLDPANVTLVMDNDSGYWVFHSEDAEVSRTESERLKKEYGEPNGYGDLVDLAIAAGINCEWC